jgi:addiction module RelE/StbE family toxin
MWIIYEKKSLTKIIATLPVNVVKHYELWKKIVEQEGQQGLRLIKGLHDEALKGSWKGYRSSRLTKDWRVIYRVEKRMCEAYVIEINCHDYRKR